ncbi:MAG: hypothetical protein AAGL24_08475 [Pseudomonadota bacterium]
MTIAIVVSYGDFFDRLSILQIKKERITDPEKRAIVLRELERYGAARDAAGIDAADIAARLKDLREVNERLWDIENRIRDHERREDFGTAFVALARSVYQVNDRRARIKKSIDEALGSPVHDVKDFTAPDDERV